MQIAPIVVLLNENTVSSVKLASDGKCSEEEADLEMEASVILL